MSASALTLYLINKGWGVIETVQPVKRRGERVCPHIKARLERSAGRVAALRLSLGASSKDGCTCIPENFHVMVASWTSAEKFWQKTQILLISRCKAVERRASATFGAKRVKMRTEEKLIQMQSKAKCAPAATTWRKRNNWRWKCVCLLCQTGYNIHFVQFKPSYII